MEQSKTEMKTNEMEENKAELEIKKKRYNTNWEKKLEEAIKVRNRKDIQVRVVSSKNLKKIVGPSFAELLEYYRTESGNKNAVDALTNTVSKRSNPNDINITSDVK